MAIPPLQTGAAPRLDNIESDSLPTTDSSAADGAPVQPDTPSSPGSEVNLDAMLARERVERSGDARTVAYEGPTSAPPLTDVEVGAKIAMVDRRLGSLPQWTEQSMKLFAMKFPSSMFEKQEVHIPTMAELQGHPMVQIFQANNRAAAGDLATSKELFAESRTTLREGDPAGARQLYDVALGYEHAGMKHIARNEKWLKMRADKVVDAMDKHATDLVEMGVNVGSAMGADAYLAGKLLGLMGKGFQALRELRMAARGSETAAKSLLECEKIARMDINEAKLYLKCGDEKAIRELNGARSKVLDTYLSDPQKLKTADAALLEKCSWHGAGGEAVHLTAAEVGLMQKNLEIVGKIDKQAMEAQGVTREILAELEKNPGAAANRLRDLVTDPGKLLTCEPKELLRLGREAGVDLRAADAKLLITGADPKLMKMNLLQAANRLEKVYGSPQAAQQLREFYNETRGHVRAVQESAKLLEKRLPQWKALDQQKLIKDYGMSAQEAEAFQRDLAHLPVEDFRPTYHDVLGPGKKTGGDIGTFMSRPGKAAEDPTVAWAIQRHNQTSLHHHPNTSGSRMESAIDMIAAMRQERVYRPQSMPWSKGAHGEDIQTIIFGGGPKRLGPGTGLEKYRDLAKPGPRNPAEGAWKKFMYKEMQSLDENLLRRPQDMFKSFVQG
ncbi:MAG: hypothetical protein NTW28_35040 [Candidatus Solibacter sp.]|nr:hypothetical protein [Candidatus Solibacter sp.]